MKKEIREIDTTMLKYEDMGKINANKCRQVSLKYCT